MADAPARPTPSPSPPVTTTLLLRRLLPADLAEVLYLLRLWSTSVERLQQAAVGGALFALVEVGAATDEAVAAALVTAPRPGGSVELLALAVAPDQRLAGIGSRLLREVTDVLRAEGVGLVTARAHADPSVRRLYERAGFRAVPGALEAGFELEL